MNDSETFDITLYSKTGESVAKYVDCRDLYQGEGYITFFRMNGQYVKTNLDWVTERK